MSKDLSVGLLIGTNKGECGYCHSGDNSSISFGVWAYTMSATQYQLMIDHGWYAMNYLRRRRSGKYLYKPNMKEMCCPPYAIRLDCTDYKPSKSQSKVLKKMQKFLLNGTGIKKFTSSQKALPTKSTDFVSPHIDIPNFETTKYSLLHSVSGQVDPENDIQPEPSKKPTLDRKNGLSSLFDIIETHRPDSSHRLKIVLDPSAYTDDTFELYQKYQVNVHHDSLNELTASKFTQFLVDSPIRSIGPYGSFHQKYYIDDKLIALAVLDVLPSCISSVYFIYDPDYADLSLG
jgi:arginine-tRNA-protein transferase